MINYMQFKTKTIRDSVALIQLSFVLLQLQAKCGVSKFNVGVIKAVAMLTVYKPHVSMHMHNSWISLPRINISYNTTCSAKAIKEL